MDAFHGYFKVQVRSGGTTGCADFGDGLAALDDVAHFDHDLPNIGVPSQQAPAVVYFDQVAVLRVRLERKHHAASGSIDAGSDVSCKVLTCAQGNSTREGIGAETNARD